MCEREMTLGEEIINLTANGIDASTVERMYRKYITSISNEIVKEPAIVGTQIEVLLGKLGNFTATVQKITNDKVLFIFDDYIIKRPMNEDGNNSGGYDKSDLKKWIDTELYNMFPTVLKLRMTDLSIPTLGEICGWDDEWAQNHIEVDGNEQLSLMKHRQNRIAYYNNGYEWGWLRNATQKQFSSNYFAVMDHHGNAGFNGASNSWGVRPEFWLWK